VRGSCEDAVAARAPREAHSTIADSAQRRAAAKLEATRAALEELEALEHALAAALDARPQAVRGLPRRAAPRRLPRARARHRLVARPADSLADGPPSSPPSRSRAARR